MLLKRRRLFAPARPVTPAQQGARSKTMISTQSTGDRRLTPSQREALGKFVPNPFPLAHPSTPVRQPSSEPLPMRPRWIGWR